MSVRVSQVTIMVAENDVCWGNGFQVFQKVRTKLDELGGYVRLLVSDVSCMNNIVYLFFSEDRI